VKHGLLIAGEVLSGTDWCQRDSRAWWDPESKARHSKWKGAEALDRYQLRPRADKIDVLVGHWTAGEAGTRSYADDGMRVVEVMKRRESRKRPGQRLRASAQFIIGACEPYTEFAPVWQTMDLANGWAATHVGRGPVNARSIGVEVVSAGLDGLANSRDREEVAVFLLGRRNVLEFYPGQLRSWVRLANALSGSCLPGGIEIPRSVPAEPVDEGTHQPLSRRFTKKELRRWSGAMEHYLMDNTNKVDAGTLLLQALLDDGWAPRPL